MLIGGMIGAAWRLKTQADQFSSRSKSSALLEVPQRWVLAVLFLLTVALTQPMSNQAAALDLFTDSR